MRQYLQTLHNVLQNGVEYPDRTGAGRKSLIGLSETYSLSDDTGRYTLPLVTTRKLAVQNMVKELFAFIHGKTDVKSLGEKFWGAWAPDDAYVENYVREKLKDQPDLNEEMVKGSIEAIKKEKVGTIGPMYGHLWRSYPTTQGKESNTWCKHFEDIPQDVVEAFKQTFLSMVLLSNGEVKNDKESFEGYALTWYNAPFKGEDQLAKVIYNLKHNPYSTHHRVIAHHPSLVGPHADPRLNVMEGYGALNACHTYFQFFVRPDPKDKTKKTLSCLLYMGSSDVCLGRPYNIAQYSLLTIMIAQHLGYRPYEFTIMSGDTHVYMNHIEQALKQIQRDPVKAPVYVEVAPKPFFSLTPEDITILNYQPREHIPYAANV